MAITVNRLRRTIQLTAIGEDWVLSSLDLASDKIESVSFLPGAADDVLVMKEGSATGPAVVNIAAAVVTTQIQEFKGGHDLFLDHSDCTLTAGHSVTIILAR